MKKTKILALLLMLIMILTVAFAFSGCVAISGKVTLLLAEVGERNYVQQYNVDIQALGLRAGDTMATLMERLAEMEQDQGYKLMAPVFGDNKLLTSIGDLDINDYGWSRYIGMFINDKSMQDTTEYGQHIAPVEQAGTTLYFSAKRLDEIKVKGGIIMYFILIDSEYVDPV
jgi:hypothetical protein